MNAAVALRRAAACRRLASRATQPEIARALRELAEDYERVALEQDIKEPRRPPRKPIA